MRPVQVRDLAGHLPCEVFSRLSRCVAPLAGSLPPHIFHRRKSLISYTASISLSSQGAF